MYTITKGPSKLVAQRRTGPTQQQVEGRLGELLKCRQPAPPTSQPPRAQPFAQPPGPWPLSRDCLSRHPVLIPWDLGAARERAEAPRSRPGPSVHGGKHHGDGGASVGPGPRLVFNRVNGRRAPSTSPSLEGTQETYTLAHEENVRFVSEAWQQVQQQLDGGPAGEGRPRPVQLRAH
ncbi:MAPK regulated corepressor interacting protein 2 isoform X2 [Macaca fascicularis]|uniref:MAPK regulated corepressor interacting protein 2 isoform X2 n=1 Tax=Macaca fascicularis TaxID=9541 RepID=UPI001E257CDF|nr:MAPK regulated corepressor interacting protein 2 isoform X2 [Macaca fascicularis]